MHLWTNKYIICNDTSFAPYVIMLTYKVTWNISLVVCCSLDPWTWQILRNPWGMLKTMSLLYHSECSRTSWLDQTCKTVAINNGMVDKFNNNSKGNKFSVSFCLPHFILLRLRTPASISPQAYRTQARAKA